MTLSIERRAGLWGDRTAIVDVSESELYAPARTIEERRVSYDDLARATREFAAGVETKGIEAGDVVSSLTRNRVASIALCFACRRLEATFAPISHRLTPATVEEPIERIDPDLVVHEPAQRDLVRALSRAGTTTFENVLEAGTDGDGSPPDGSSDASSSPLCFLHAEDGTPVVAFSEAAVEANCLTAVTTWGFGRTDRVPLCRPLSTYDGLFRVALPTLYVGGTLVLDRAFDPGDAIAAMAREGATVLAGRATEFRELADREGFEDALSAVDIAILEGTVPRAVRSAYLEAGIPPVRARGYLECPNAMVEPSVECPNAMVEPSGIDADEDGYRPVLDCEARVLEDDAGVETEGVLALSGPLLAEGYVNHAGTRDGSNGEARTDSTEPTGRGWFETDCFVTREPFHRDETGRYRPVDDA
ncbi:AMP-binding protein [Natrialbaceae archaeon A-gly3]